MQQVFVVFEFNRCALQHAAAFNIDFAVVVHEDVGDGRILHQRLQGAEAEDFIQDLLDDAVALRQRHRDILLQQELLDGPADFATQPFLADESQCFAVERLEQLAVDLRLEIGTPLRRRSRTLAAYRVARAGRWNETHCVLLNYGVTSTCPTTNYPITL